MNLKEIKLRFSTFLNQFNKDDIKLLMQFLEMIVDEYNSNPYKLFEFLSVNQKYDEINENSDCNSLNEYEIDRSNSGMVDSPNKLTSNTNDEEIIEEEEENDPYLAIVSPNPANNNLTSLNRDLNCLSSPNNSLVKNSNGKRVSCESNSNLPTPNNINTGNYILNRIGMIKGRSELQNKVRILDNESDANGLIEPNIESLTPFLLNLNNLAGFNVINNNDNLNKAIASPETLNTSSTFSNYNNNNSSSKGRSTRSLSNALYKISQLNAMNILPSNTSASTNDLTSLDASADSVNTQQVTTNIISKPIVNEYQPTKNHYSHNSSKICEVCEAENGTGNHYGAFTCNSCRDFFKRAISIKFQLQCLFNENCSIVKENRLKCRRCRLIKCFKVGMKSTDPSDNKWPSIYGVTQTNKAITNKSKQSDDDNSNKELSETSINTNNLSSNNSNSSSNQALANNVKGCSICEDVGSGYFYGVFACTNCAKFYSRHRISQSQYNLVCPFENNCELNQSVKKKCSKCRFEKYKRIIEQVTLENSYVDKRFRANRNINRNPPSVIPPPLAITNNSNNANNNNNSQTNNNANINTNNTSSTSNNSSPNSTSSNSSNTPSTNQNGS